MAEDVPANSALAAISGEMVRLYKEHFGRGPTRVRTEWAGDDVITAVIEQTLTPVERRLRDLGEHQRLRETRLFYQHASRQEFIAPVEQLTGRRVRAFVSGVDPVEDVSVETFVPCPAGDD